MIMTRTFRNDGMNGRNPTHTKTGRYYRPALFSEQSSTKFQTDFIRYIS